MCHKGIAVIIFTLLLARGDCHAQDKAIDPIDLPPTISESQKLTLLQSQGIAQKQSPLLRATIHQIAGARANLSGQRAPLNPVLNVTAITNTPGTFDPTDPTKYGLVYTLETSGRQRIRTQQALAQLRGTEADAQTMALVVRQSVSSAYIDLQVANRGLENEKLAYETAQQLSDLTEKKFKLGDAPETNAIRARIALTQEEQNLLRVASDVKLGRAALNVQMGRLPEEPVDTLETLQFTPLALNLEDLQRRALATRPELRTAAANRDALRAVVSNQRSLSYPDLAIGVNPRAAAVGQVQLSLAFPIFDFGSIRGAVHKAQEDVKAQEVQTEQTRQLIRLDVENAYLLVSRSQRAIQNYQDGILPRAESLLSKIEQGYALGASSILDLIDAQQTLRMTRNEYYNVIGDYRRALIQLERAVGSPVR